MLFRSGVPASRVEREVGDLLAEVNGYTGPWTLTATAYLHARFEHLHPFADGNGRVGRTLVNYYLMQHDHPPMVIYEEDREQYLAALAAYDMREDLEPLENLFRQMTEKTWKLQLMQLEEQSRGHKPLAAFADEAPC